MDQSLDIVNIVSTLLDSGKYKEALSIPNGEKYKDNFKDNCWDLISLIVGKIQDDTIVIKPSLYGACEQLMALIIDKSTPEEALLEFIEQIELAKNDAQFSIILTPLQHLLKKLSVKRGRSLEWCLNSICTYIEGIPIPEYHLEGNERLLMDCDSNVRRIAKVYSILPPFYDPFVKELIEPDKSTKTKQIITAFLISLLGKPMIYIDLDPESNAHSEATLCCSTIIEDICTLEKNVLKLLKQVEICNKERINSTTRDSDYEKSPYEHREKINLTTLSGLYYTVFSGHFKIPEAAIPQVYSTEYIVHTIMLSVVHLLSFTEYGPLAKAISLCRSILNRFTNKMSYNLLSSSVHFELSKNLMNIAIYSSYLSIRKDAVSLIGCHINKFDFKGRCLLIKYLIGSANHSGMVGYAITLYKNSMNEAFNEPTLHDCFTGAQLLNMINKICCLPHGVESDLMELADQIIAALNFLRFLVLKDKNNKTGVRDFFSVIEKDYLDKLRTALNMSKAHYEVKLNDIEKGNKLPEEKVNISLNVGGNVLDKIPVENKKEIILSALNAFHLIECLVARVSEFIHNY